MTASLRERDVPWSVPAAPFRESTESHALTSQTLSVRSFVRMTTSVVGTFRTSAVELTTSAHWDEADIAVVRADVRK